MMKRQMTTEARRLPSVPEANAAQHNPPRQSIAHIPQSTPGSIHRFQDISILPPGRSPVQRELTKEDAEALTKYVTEKYTEKQRPKGWEQKIEDLVTSTTISTLAVAKQRFDIWASLNQGHSKIASGVKNTMNNPELAKQKKLEKELSKPSLKAWLTSGEDLKTALHPCVTMNSEATVTGSGMPFIVYTGGAADCIAVGAYNSGTAFVRHATALETKSANDRDSLAGFVVGTVGSGATVFLSSQAINAENAQELIKALTEKGLKVVATSSTGNLAVNAKTGEYLFEFQTTELK